MMKALVIRQDGTNLEVFNSGGMAPELAISVKNTDVSPDGEMIFYTDNVEDISEIIRELKKIRKAILQADERDRAHENDL